MAATPPLQLLASPDTPSTPLHGARYSDNSSPQTRFSSRLRQKREREVEQINETWPNTTPHSPHKRSRPNLTQSPAATPKRNFSRQAQINSPTSPGSDSFETKPVEAQHNPLRPFLSANTTLSSGMLPTPIKTPKKKPISKMGSTARALFQDSSTLEDVMPSPKKSRKNQRFNGYSLESFRADDEGTRQGIQVFTDSRDQIPETDNADDNPFLEDDKQATSAKRISGTAKRRKVASSRPLDPQVAEAIRNDDGMVYVFRGRKVFRRFDDVGDEEEEIDPSDLGLLEHVKNGGRIPRSFTTLTRKSIKPTRLFQAEQKRLEGNSERDEEADTDIDEEDAGVETPIKHKSSAGACADPQSPTSEIEPHNSLKSLPKKKTSPFDSWARLKSSSVSSPRSMRSRKRAASQDLADVAI